MSSPVLFTLILLVLVAQAASLIGKLGCRTRCGGVDIPYPFGMGTIIINHGVDYALPGLEISRARNLTGSPMPALADTDIEVPRLTVMPRQCFSSTGANTGFPYGTVKFNHAGVYHISDTHNELSVLSCNTLMYTGCMTYCNDSRARAGWQVRRRRLLPRRYPAGLTDNWMQSGDESSWSHVDRAFIVEKAHFTFRASDLTTMPVNKTMPLWLHWAIRDGNISSMSMSCAADKRSPGYACVSLHSECINSTNGPGYFCNCTNGYDGNPYVVNGCTRKDRKDDRLRLLQKRSRLKETRKDSTNYRRLSK